MVTYIADSRASSGRMSEKHEAGTSVEHAEEYYRGADSAATEDGKLLNHDQYATGFLDAVVEVWRRVAPEL